MRTRLGFYLPYLVSFKWCQYYCTNTASGSPISISNGDTFEVGSCSAIRVRRSILVNCLNRYRARSSGHKIISRSRAVSLFTPVGGIYFQLGRNREYLKVISHKLVIARHVYPLAVFGVHSPTAVPVANLGKPCAVVSIIVSGCFCLLFRPACATVVKRLIKQPATPELKRTGRLCRVDRYEGGNINSVFGVDSDAFGRYRIGIIAVCIGGATVGDPVFDRQIPYCRQILFRNINSIPGIADGNNGVSDSHTGKGDSVARNGGGDDTFLRILGGATDDSALRTRCGAAYNNIDIFRFIVDNNCIGRIADGHIGGSGIDAGDGDGGRCGDWIGGGSCVNRDVGGGAGAVRLLSANLSYITGRTGIEIAPGVSVSRPEQKL